jgi:hypothetical protein
MGKRLIAFVMAFAVFTVVWASAVQTEEMYQRVHPSLSVAAHHDVDHYRVSQFESGIKVVALDPAGDILSALRVEETERLFSIRTSDSVGAYVEWQFRDLGNNHTLVRKITSDGRGRPLTQVIRYDRSAGTFIHLDNEENDLQGEMLGLQCDGGNDVYGALSDVAHSSLEIALILDENLQPFFPDRLKAIAIAGGNADVAPSSVDSSCLGCLACVVCVICFSSGCGAMVGCAGCALTCTGCVVQCPECLGGAPEQP